MNTLFWKLSGKWQQMSRATEAGHYLAQGNVFTAGDMHRGQSLVVWAIAEGHACAREVDEYLMGYTTL